MDTPPVSNPGPNPWPPPIQEALAAELVSHRSATFEATDEHVRAGVSDAFTHANLDGLPTADGGGTPIVNATATMAMVAAITNRVPGDRRVGA